MRYAIRRMLLTVPLMVVVTFVVFSMLKLIKGSPVKVLLGVSYTDENAERLTNELGLDRPFLIQYFKWFGNCLQGNLGYSYFSRQPVSTLLKSSLPVSLHLVVMSMLLTLLISIPLGIYSAYRVGGRFDRLVSAGAFASLSLPGFVVGLLLLMFVAVRWNWLPAGNYVSVFDSPIDSVRHLLLPSLSISSGLIANYVRTLRTDMVATLQEDYISLAKSKGLSDRRILWRHAFRPSSLTLATVAGVNVGSLIGNTLIAERLFRLPGMGSQIVEALFSRDYLVVLGGVGIITIVFVLLTTFVDVLYGVIDPRVRHARALS